MRLIKEAMVPVEPGSAQSFATSAGYILGLRPSIAFKIVAPGGQGAHLELYDAGPSTSELGMTSEEAPLEGDDET